MKLNELLTMGIVTDNTPITLKIGEGPAERRITGYWYEDKILSMTGYPVTTFVWQSNGVLIANLAGEPRDEHTERLSRQATAILIKQFMQFEGR